jgi:hypothetical protein
MYLGNLLMYDLLCSVTMKVRVTSSTMEQAIDGNWIPCSWAMVSHIWLKISYFLISFKVESLFHIDMTFAFVSTPMDKFHSSIHLHFLVVLGFEVKVEHLGA